MKQILIVKPKSISPKDKEKLSKNGFVVVEHDTPDTVRIIQQFDEATGTSITMSAIQAMTTSFTSRDEFSKELAKRILATEKSKAA